MPSKFVRGQVFGEVPLADLRASCRFFIKVVSNDLVSDHYLQPNGARTTNKLSAACWVVASHDPTNGLARIRTISPIPYGSFTLYNDISIAAPYGQTDWDPSSVNQNPGNVQFNAGIRE